MSGKQILDVSIGEVERAGLLRVDQRKLNRVNCYGAWRFRIPLMD